MVGKSKKMKINTLIFLFALVLFISCSRNFVKVRNYPEKFFEVIPIDASYDYEILRDENAIIANKDNIKIKIKYADFDFLFNNFSYVNEKNELGYTSIYRLVPFYIAIRARGIPDLENYFTQFTVFYVYIENNSPNPIIFDPRKCVMVDGIGNQYNALDDAFFKSNKFLYGYMEDAPFSGIKKTISPLAKVLGEVGDLANAAASITPYGGIKIKGSHDYYDESKKYDYKYPMDDKLFLAGGEIFPSVNYSGFLVFRKVADKAFTFKVVLPHINYNVEDDNQKIIYTKSLQYVFDFSKVMSPKNVYFDTSTNKIYYK